MIAGTTSDIVAMVFPVLLIVLMGIIGALRGGRREAVVSASIILGAFLGYYWAPRWAVDTADVFTDTSVDWQQLILSYAVLILSVLVLGYGLGRYVATLPLTGAGRTWGLILGIANGASLAGWLLFFVYTDLDRSDASSPLYQNPVASGFMVLALWSPVGLALLGALAALIAPFRRSPVVVTTTAATVAAPVAAASMAPVAPPPMMPAQHPSPSQIYGGQVSDQYGSHNAPTAVYPYVPTQNQPPAYNPSGSGSSQYGANPYPLDSARVAPPADNPPYNSSVPTYGSTPYSSPYGSSTTTTTTTSTSDPGVSGATTRGAYSSSPPASLSSSSGDVGSGAAGKQEVVVGTQPSWVTDAPSNGPAVGPTQGTSSGPITGPLADLHAESAPQPSTTILSPSSDASTVCANCGAALAPNARFCTTCGTPVARG